MHPRLISTLVLGRDAHMHGANLWLIYGMANRFPFTILQRTYAKETQRARKRERDEQR